MVEVTVVGTICRHDARIISAALSDLEGVVALRVDASTGTVAVEGDVATGAVREAIVAAGYVVR